MIVVEDINKHLTSQNQIFSKDYWGPKWYKQERWLNMLVNRLGGERKWNPEPGARISLGENWARRCPPPPPPAQGRAAMEESESPRLPDLAWSPWEEAALTQAVWAKQQRTKKLRREEGKNLPSKSEDGLAAKSCPVSNHTQLPC